MPINMRGTMMPNYWQGESILSLKSFAPSSLSRTRHCVPGRLTRCYASTRSRTPFHLMLLSLLVLFVGSANADTRIDLRCKIAEFSVSADFEGKIAVEEFHIDDSITEGGWGISTSEMTSNGKKLNPSLVDLTSEHVVLALAVKTGEDYSKRLLAFTYLIDLKAMEVTRVVVSLPGEINQRATGKCENGGDA